MAGDWIKMEKITPDKPEVYAIANLLNIDPDAVFGKLFRVWSWFDDHSEIGNAPSVTKMLLDRITGVTGFADAMIDAGWMIEDDGQLLLPNFNRHNGQTAKNRALTAKRVSKTRNKSNADTVTGSNDDVTQTPLPREEKRREEKSNKDQDQNTYVKSAKTDQKNGIPVKSIIDLYHEILPELPEVKKITKAREAQIKQRWREDMPDLKYWRNFFTYVRSSDFLMGRAPPGVGRDKPFLADLEWITKASNFTKIAEKKYER